MTETVGFRLSPQQRLLWLRGEGAAARRSSCVVGVEGPASADGLAEALRGVVQRHEILRTSFETLPAMDQPVQVIADVAGVEVDALDLTAEPPDARAAALEAVVARHAVEPDGPDALPPLRATLLTEAADRHRLVLSAPALAADAHTLHAVVAELAALGGDAAELDPEPLQYADVAEWLNELLESDETADARGHWSALGDRLSRDALLAARFERGGSPTVTTVSLDGALCAALDQAARARSASVDAVVLSGWSIVLSRLTGQRELAIGVAGGARHLDDLQGVLGPLERHVPLLIAVDPHEPAGELVARTGAALREAARRQEYFNLATAGADAGFFPVAFESVSAGPVPPGGATTFSLETVRAPVDRAAVRLVCVHGEGGLDLELHLEVAGGAELLADAAGRLIPVLRGIAEGSPEVAAVDVLGPEETAAAVARGAGAPLAARETTFVEQFAQQVARTPDRVALVFEGETLDYATLDAHADGLAARLRERGAGTGTLVGVCLPPGLPVIVAILGVMKAGAAYVPLDHGSPPARLAALCEDAGLSLVVAEAADSPAFDGVTVVAPDERGAAAFGGPAPGDLAYAIYTSGSTGGPKGVLVEHRSVIALHNAMRAAIHEQHVGDHAQVLLNAPLTFDASVQQLVALLDGHTLHLVPDSVRRDAETLVQRARDAGIDVLNCTPTQLETLVAAGLLDPAGHTPAVLLVAGEALPGSLWDALARSGTTAAYNIYGPTECTVNATAVRVAAPGPPTIGGPLPGYEAHVLDEWMRPVPADWPGELYLGGAAVAQGYLGRPGLTAAAFVPHPFSGAPGARLYRTGDLASVAPDGRIDFLGRIDDQVKIRGFRVEPAEIETALEAHDAVRAAAVAVAGLDHDRRLVAYWIPADREAAPAGDDLRAFLAARLPGHLVPSAFVELDAFPLSRTGKLDRAALPDPEGVRPDLRSAYAAPESPDEQRLADIWAAVLRVDRVGIDDNFFALGGDSIRSIEVRVRASQQGIEFAVQDLFENQTIRELARVSRPHAGAAEAPVASAPFALLDERQRAALPDDAVDAYPLTSMQASMLFHVDYGAAQRVFHNVRTVHLRTRITPDAIVAAVAELVTQHRVLRTSIDLGAAGGPVQIVHASADAEVNVADLRDLPPDAQQKVVEEYLAAEKARPFDPARAPFVRFGVHRRSDDSLQLTITEHETILDGWSVALLLSDLFERAAAIDRGAPLGTSPQATTFADYVAVERASVSEEGLEFWAARLDGAQPTTLARWELGGEPEAHAVAVPEDVSATLQRLARELEVPMKSVLFAVHVRAISVLAGSDEIVTGLISNGRLDTSGGDRVAGQFLNTLPMRANAGRTSWRELIRQVAAAEQEAFAFRRTPIAEIQRATAAESLLDTAFNYTHFHVYRGPLESGAVELVDDDFSEVTDLSLLADFSIDVRSGRVRLAITCSHLQPETVAGAIRVYAACLDDVGRAADAARWDPSAVVAGGRGSTSSAPSGGPADVSYAELFARQAAASPDAVAVTCGDTALTYAELHRRADSVAAFLADRGVGCGDVVGLAVGRDTGTAVAMLGVLKAGAAFLGLDDRDPPPLRAATVLRARCRAVLVAGGRRTGDEGPPQFDVAEAAGSERAPARRAHPQDPAYVVSTSGTTGAPRAVVVTQRALVEHCRTKVRELELGPHDVVAQTSPLAFDVHVWQMLAVLLAGGSARILESEASFTPGRLLDELAGQQVTIAQTVPSLLAWAFSGRPPELPHLRCMIATGEELPAALARRWLEQYPQVRLINAYGPAECADQVASTPLPEGSFGARCPIGTASPGTQLHVLDESMNLVPRGVAGMLYVGGATVGLGYRGEPAMTAGSFVPDPFAPGHRLFRTGDVARMLEDGRLEWLGRRDRMVKIRGVRIEPAGVEAVLMRLPEVQDAAVVVRGGESLAAFVVLAPDAPGAMERVARHARESLPPSLVPSLIGVDELPVTPNGKRDRAALASLAEEMVTSVRARPGKPLDAPVAELWAEVLGLEAMDVDVDFFTAGGTSMLAAHLVARMRAMLDMDIPLTALYEAPTVAQLIDRLHPPD